MIGTAPMTTYALASEPATAVIVVPALELFINGFDFYPYLLQGTLEIERKINDRSSARFTIINPQFLPSAGSVVRIRRYGTWRFGGTIERLRSDVSTNDVILSYQVECADWSRTLERRTLTYTTFNVSAKDLIYQLLTITLSNESLYPAFLEDSPTFPYIEIKDLRFSEVFRDVADGSGMSWWVDPEQGVHLVKTAYAAAPFTLGDGTIVDPQVEETREQYRNVMYVTVTGTPPDTSAQANEVSVTRQDDNEIWNRYIIEGGTGRYEVIEKLTHPASNDPIELQKLGITYCIFRLRRSGRNGRPFRATTYTFGLEPGMLASVDVSRLGLNKDSMIITSVTEKHQDTDFWQYDVEGTFTDPNELVTEAYLRMLQTGRAILLMPIGVFVGTNAITSSGDFTITGSGSVEVQVVCNGASGGGGGYTGISQFNGGKGGNGGKASSFRTFPAGTVLTVTIGTAGASGAGMNRTVLATHSTPGSYDVAVPGTGTVELELVVSGGGGGGGGMSGLSGTLSGGNGGNGAYAVTRIVATAGMNVHMVVGSGGSGGAGGATGVEAAGHNGGNGTNSEAYLDGFLEAFGTGGQGGGGAFFSLNAPRNGTAGACGTPSGTYSAVPCGGGAGGLGGLTNSSVNGSAGADGFVTVYYADANAGGNGSITSVYLGSELIASADGGVGGAAGMDGNAVGGTDGGAIGDQAQPGNGRPGGDGGWASVIDGQPGQPGTAEIIF